MSKVKVYKKESVLLKDNTTNSIVADSVAMLRDAGLNEEYILTIMPA